MQYVIDDHGAPTAVLLTMDEWREIEARLNTDDSERDDTEYLRSSPIMRDRILAAMASDDLMGLNEVRRALGV